MEDGLEVSTLRFLTCSPNTCEKIGGVNDDFIDTTVYLRCPVGTVGARQMICRDVDNKGVWLEDQSTCLKKHPSKGFVFFFWSIRLLNVTSAFKVYVPTSLKSMLEEKLELNEEDVHFYLIQIYQCIIQHLFIYRI